MDKEAFDAAVKRAAIKRDEGKIGVSTYERNTDMRDFANADGDTDTKHLSLKYKKAESNDAMPSIDSLISPRSKRGSSNT